MRFYTHLAFGLFFSALLFIPFDWLPLLFVLFGSLLPDIDYPFSLIGKAFPKLSEKFYKWFGHRSLTHSAYIVIGLMIGAFLYPSNVLVYAFTIGYTSHLLTDMYTPSGVQLFYPFNYSFTIFEGNIKTGSKKEYLLAVLSSIGFVLLLFFRDSVYSLML